MNAKRLSLLLASLCIFSVSSMLLAEDDPALVSPSAKILEGKIVFITVDESKDAEELGSSTFMIDAKLEQIGGRLFIVGKGYGGASAWYKDMTMAIAWKNVNRFFVLTPEQYKTMEKFWSESDDEA